MQWSQDFFRIRLFSRSATKMNSPRTAELGRGDCVQRGARLQRERPRGPEDAHQDG
jgi:hypothetical protein